MIYIIHIKTPIKMMNTISVTKFIQVKVKNTRPTFTKIVYHTVFLRIQLTVILSFVTGLWRYLSFLSLTIFFKWFFIETHVHYKSFTFIFNIYSDNSLTIFFQTGSSGVLLILCLGVASGGTQGTMWYQGSHGS